ncbi:UDP-N-acetylmuramate dehydrogenase [uncultured Veillonella sp.]|uniref:UDP-N-acetylmuramate dehydrogenase n=1 Tax=uncultured Veillonella sp. TaxID=159268 RepID=UPI0025E74488|nr:UDP-N-acetylmuramate dehydrogenase [uncultured Veillonella sp.]
MLKNKLEVLYEELSPLLGAEQILRNEPLKEHTTFKIGGPADLFIMPRTLTELSQTMQAVAKADIPLTILGSGSNVLVLDGGIQGVVVSLCHMKETLDCKGHSLLVSSGFMLKEVSEFAYNNSLTGLEFAIGIPGTLGGAVFMNAGAYGGEMSQVVTKVRAVSLTGQINEYSIQDLEFAYRHSRFHESHEIVAEVEIDLAPGVQADILAAMEDLTERRTSKQPLEYASAGSTFKRPTGYYAGTLIEQTGLKGLACGDAEVSTKHAGFVVNKGEASASDVLQVIREVQSRVEKAHGVKLETEVRIIGRNRVEE